MPSKVPLPLNLKSKPFEASGDSGQKYTADSIIISTGAQARWLNLKSEQEFRGFGVSACATCDGFFFKNKEVAVVGGGNAAVEEAMFLTKFASKVKLIHRRDELRAEKLLQKKLMDNKKIEIVWDSVVEDVVGDQNPKNLKGIILRLGTIFGVSKGMRFHTAVNKFCYQAAFKKPLTIWKTAYDQKRPYLDLQDACAVVEFITCPATTVSVPPIPLLLFAPEMKLRTPPA